MRSWVLVGAAVALVLGLASCRANDPLLSGVSTTAAALRVTGDGDEPGVIHYTLTRPADVTVWLADATGRQLVLRDRQRRPPGVDYQLSFDGTYVPDANSPE